jgi:hypothetical protein
MGTGAVCFSLRRLYSNYENVFVVSLLSAPPAPTKKERPKGKKCHELDFFFCFTTNLLITPTFKSSALKGPRIAFILWVQREVEASEFRHDTDTE